MFRFQISIIFLSFAILSFCQLKTVEAATPKLMGKVLAVGIPGIGGVSAVGFFHPGGPIHDKPNFRAYTQPGAILDRERILVTSTSNFGAPLARTDQPPGSVLSIDPRSPRLIQIPPKFAVSDGQAVAIKGRVMLLTANSTAFLNRVHNPRAVTANFSPVTNPTGISINNAFGRVWFTSMPAGIRGAGILSVIDPDGCPLEGAPNKVAGGVFTATLSRRVPQLLEGSMTTGALASAFLGRSPDGDGRAVFAVVNADGGLVQVHAEKGIDGLAPTNTITPLITNSKTTRVGMIFNWVPNKTLYVTDPAANSIIAMFLRADNKIFHVVGLQRLTSFAFDIPVDIAPAIAETANSGFSSNTTIAGGADFYVANRGNGTVVRMRQNGTVVAVRKITLPGIGLLGAGRLNGIAISPDGRLIWLTVSGRMPSGLEGAVIQLPTFGGSNTPHKK